MVGISWKRKEIMDQISWSASYSSWFLISFNWLFGQKVFCLRWIFIHVTGYMVKNIYSQSLEIEPQQTSLLKFCDSLLETTTLFYVGVQKYMSKFYMIY